ncbi:hypothetical protein GQ457_01G006820 [Hibiscus cannabinus]
MERISFVVLSLALALVLSLQCAVVKSKHMPKGGMEAINEKQDNKVTSKEVKKDVRSGLKDAVKKGLVKDTSANPDDSFSPQQEEEFLMKLFFKVMMKMADEGRMDPKVLREKLFPGVGETKEPKIQPEVIQALRDAMRETENVQEGKVAATKR